MGAAAALSETDRATEQKDLSGGLRLQVEGVGGDPLGISRRSSEGDSEEAGDKLLPKKKYKKTLRLSSDVVVRT